MNTEALRFTQERETTSSLFVGIDSLEDFIFEEDMVPIRKSSILVAERESLANENPFRSDGNIIQISQDNTLDLDSFFLQDPILVEENEGSPPLVVAVESIGKRIKRKKQCSPADYDKNIIRYIATQCLKAFRSSCYQNFVKKICQIGNVNYEEVMHQFQTIPEVTGPIHLRKLLDLNYKNQEQDEKTEVLKVFFVWFLKEKYIRYIAKEGKMKLLQRYIENKNKLIAIIPIAGKYLQLFKDPYQLVYN